MKKSKGFVEGHNPKEGHGSFANMPQEVIMRPYPKNKVSRDNEIDDTISGIDNVVKVAEGKRSKYMSNQK